MLPAGQFEVHPLESALEVDTEMIAGAWIACL